MTLMSAYACALLRECIISSYYAINLKSSTQYTCMYASYWAGKRPITPSPISKPLSRAGGAAQKGRYRLCGNHRL
ncbi:uncharacterized protein LAJ45_02107 [Morchella importuna]|uniref:uncharacterized protein n=1 Tax=Morchella importuna TaxID=1174673 RepID=UPI001E8DB51D|nr:uncharacterized protein LAJ45_02107 [Morchella importuna]KAH8154339.1 hypothetical protein LAJ45_02107 [Morchella importuna]